MYQKDNIPGYCHIKVKRFLTFLIACYVATRQDL